MDNKVFYYALLASVFLHALAFTLFSIKKKEKMQARPKAIEVTYQKMASPSQQAPTTPQNIKVVKKEPQVKDKVDILSKEKLEIPSMRQDLKDISKFSRQFKLEKKTSDQIDTVKGRGKIRIPLLKSAKITNVKYLAYIQKIREIIKNKAEEYIESPDLKEQEIYLTFVLESSGLLQEIKVIEEKSNANEYLRDIGLKCIRESSPFPPFPKDINYPELSFNIIISINLSEE